MQLRLGILLGGLLVSASPAFAQVHVFDVTTTQPGTMNFRGLGTATYNNSTGTSNGISLGSSSSLIVSNNLSASKEYTGTTSALVQLTGEGATNFTNFLQTIGSSTGAVHEAIIIAKSNINMLVILSYTMSIIQILIYSNLEGKLRFLKIFK